MIIYKNTTNVLRTPLKVICDMCKTESVVTYNGYWAWRDIEGVLHCGRLEVGTWAENYEPTTNIQEYDLCPQCAQKIIEVITKGVANEQSAMRNL